MIPNLPFNPETDLVPVSLRLTSQLVRNSGAKWPRPYVPE